MLKERYQQLCEHIHADEALIDRTLDAAAPSRTKAVSRPAVGKRLIFGFACALVLLAVVAVRMLPPPRDVVASSGELPEATDNLLPLNTPSDELTISVSDVKLENVTTLSLILTVRGDRVDPLSTIDLDSPQSNASWAHVSGLSLSPLAVYEGQPANERRYLFSIRSQEMPILEALGNELQLDVYRYTVGNTQTEIRHAIDWNSVDFTLEDAGEPIIDLGHDMAVTGFGFSEEGWLIVQCRRPHRAPEPNMIFTCLASRDTGGEESYIYMQSGHTYSADDYVYHNDAFPITREELDGWRLLSVASSAGKEIWGSWAVTVDLTHLTAE